MNEDQFEKLKSISDKYLKNIFLNNYIGFISWLYVVRPHPQNMKDYDDLFKNKTNYYFFYELKKFFYSLVKILIKLLKYIIFKKRIYYSSVNVKKNSTDLLILSHLINYKDIGKKNDFYFSNISNLLKNVNIDSLLVLKNPNQYNEKKSIYNWKRKKIERIILPNYTNFINELVFIIKALSVRKFIKKKLYFNNNTSLDRKFHNQLLTECLSESTISSFRLNFQIKKIVKMLNPKIIMLTYEGFAWERVIFKSCREINENIICIGYQHSLINKYYYNVKKNIFNGFDPDVVLTSGECGYNIFRNEKNFNIKKLLNVGTHRSFHYFQKRKFYKNKNSDLNIIVLPEGFMNETNLLFEFTLNCAKILPNIQFIWRMHPVIDFSIFKKKYPKYKIIPKNIKISYNTLDQDLAISKFAIYRGSTSIIAAFNFNVQPILLDLNNSYLIDPLHNMQNVCLKIRKEEELVKIISNKNYIIKSNIGISDFFYSSFKKNIFLDFFKSQINNNE
tara:strand:+ start:810 stop:2321 length:1512 start_codon:yes stop_codon:yes gene_type:complete